MPSLTCLVLIYCLAIFLVYRRYLVSLSKKYNAPGLYSPQRVKQCTL